MKTENDAYLTLAALCAQAEHCQWEMTEKMRRWELSDEAQARVMERLSTRLCQGQGALQQVGPPEGGAGALAETY